MIEFEASDRGTVKLEILLVKQSNLVYDDSGLLCHFNGDHESIIQSKPTQENSYDQTEVRPLHPTISNTSA